VGILASLRVSVRGFGGRSQWLHWEDPIKERKFLFECSRWKFNNATLSQCSAGQIRKLGTTSPLAHLRFGLDLKPRGIFVIGENNVDVPANALAIRRALVAEDDVLVRMDLAQTLRDEGWQVIEAGSADEALSVLARDDVFHLLVTDVHMPGTQSGLDLARRVKESHSHIKVVVTSGEYRPTTADLIPFDLFLPKPVCHLLRDLAPLLSSLNDADTII